MKKINEGEQFQMGTQVFSYSLNESGGIVLKLSNKAVKPKKSSFVPPKLDEVIDFFKFKGFPAELAKQFFDYYEVGNWNDGGGKPVINWRQKAIAVWFKKNEKSAGKDKDFNYMF